MLQPLRPRACQRLCLFEESRPRECSARRSGADDASRGGSDGSPPSGIGGSTGLGSSSCDHVIAKIPGIFTSGDIRGLAVSKGDVFVVTENDDARIVNTV